MARLSAVYVHLAFLVCVEARYDIQQCGFAASGFPGYHDELSDAELEIYLRDPAGDHTLAVIEFRYILKLYQDTFLLPGQQTLSGDPLIAVL